MRMCPHLATHSGRAATEASSDKIFSDDLFSTSKETLLPSPNTHTHTHTTRTGKVDLQRTNIELTEVYVNEWSWFSVLEQYKLHVRILVLDGRQILFDKLSAQRKRPSSVRIDLGAALLTVCRCSEIHVCCM